MASPSIWKNVKGNRKLSQPVSGLRNAGVMISLNGGTLSSTAPNTTLVPLGNSGSVLCNTVPLMLASPDSRTSRQSILISMCVCVVKLSNTARPCARPFLLATASKENSYTPGLELLVFVNTPAPRAEGPWSNTLADDNLVGPKIMRDRTSSGSKELLMYMGISP